MPPTNVTLMASLERSGNGLFLVERLFMFGVNLLKGSVSLFKGGDSNRLRAIANRSYISSMS